jgi:glycosyltransferase involved in cell wall biosynthesis
VSRALKIWKAVEPYGYNDWKFVLVGHGNDMNYYKTLIEKNKIKNVELLGKHDPLSFYKRASIFLMTSAYEGWGMTIVEAMQNGCVPIVYDTFDAAKDIIRSNESGYVIKDGNSSEYCEKLRNLMCDDQRRKSMAQNAVSDMKRYTLDNIVKQWTELF